MSPKIEKILALVDFEGLGMIEDTGDIEDLEDFKIIEDTVDI